MKRFAVVFKDNSSTVIEAYDFSFDFNNECARFWDDKYKTVAILTSVSDVILL